MPKISIITVNLNNANGLERTINSVFSQKFTDFEYLIMDGGSTDSSKEVIERNSYRLGYWASENDAGIYNAMNKGIYNSKGDYLLFLNSGDHLRDDAALEDLAAYLDGTDIIYGNTLLIESNIKSWIGHHPEILTFSFFVDCTLPHAASFIKRSLFDQVGLYDENLVICADWKFFLNAVCRYNVTYKFVDRVISVFYLDGISSTGNSQAIIEKEKASVLKKDYPLFLQMHEELSRYKKPKKEPFKKMIIRIKYRLRRHGIIKEV